MWNAVLMIAAVAVFSLAHAGTAEARRFKPYYSQTFDTRGPVRGYEGFVAPDYYCSYKRYPKRTCRVDSRGNERCRVTGWTLEQTCQ